MRHFRRALAVFVWILLVTVHPVSAQSVYADRLQLTPCMFTTGSGTPTGGTTCDTYLDTSSGQIWTRLSAGWSPVSVLFPTEVNNHVLAGPTSGVDAQPTFRLLVANDIPSSLNATTFTGTVSASLFSGSGAGLTTLDAGNISTGNLAYARMPTGSGTWSATPTISGAVSLSSTLAVTGATTLTGGVASSIIPTVSDTYDLGRYDRLVKLDAERDRVPGVDGDTVRRLLDHREAGRLIRRGRGERRDHDQLRADDDAERLGARASARHRRHHQGGIPRVGTLVSGTTYNVTRDLASALQDRSRVGQRHAVRGPRRRGDGRIEMLAYDGKPRILFTQQGSAYNTQNDRAIVGNLNGYFGYASDIYGAAPATRARRGSRWTRRTGCGSGMRHDQDQPRRERECGVHRHVQAGSDITITRASGTSYASPSAYKFTRPGTLGGPATPSGSGAPTAAAPSTPSRSRTRWFPRPGPRT
jgi:hypothetical protein